MRPLTSKLNKGSRWLVEICRPPKFKNDVCHIRKQYLDVENGEWKFTNKGMTIQIPAAKILLKLLTVLFENYDSRTPNEGGRGDT